MKKSVWHGAGVSLAAAGLAVFFGVGSVQAGSGPSLFQLFRNGSAAQDDALPVTINGQIVAQGGKAVTTTRLVNDGSEAPFMSAGSLQALQAAEAKYRSIAAQGGWGSVSGSRYQKGDQNKAIALLNRRLYLEGYLRQEATQGQFEQVYTTATEQAVREFQHNHGLAVTGAVDTATVKELNIPVEQRIATLRANEPRFAHNAQALGSRYVIVNVPAQQLQAIENGKVFSIHNAIVGRPSRPTPVVITNLQTIRFNPYWNAPPSIVERDIVPRMLSGGASSIMNQMNMKVFEGGGGQAINPDRINWRSAVVDHYQFRQEPGGSNAMATAKIEFNSPFGIYLHDTPEPQLFNSGQRFYSSGCVRVQQVPMLINWILNGQDGFSPSKIAALAQSKERLDVTLQNPPQIRVAYLTAWPAANGTVAFRPDVYKLDGSGFIVGQPLPVGDSGPRYTLKPTVRNAAAVDAAEAGGFFSLFGSRPGRNTHNADAAGRELSSASAGRGFVRSKASMAAAQGRSAAGSKPAKARKPFDFFGSLSAQPQPAAKTGVASKKKALASATGLLTGVSSAKPAAAKTAAACKPGQDGRTLAQCKAAAPPGKVKTKAKVANATTSTAAN